jgi:hypothetical protein
VGGGVGVGEGAYVCEVNRLYELEDKHKDAHAIVGAGASFGGGMKILCVCRG